MKKCMDQAAIDRPVSCPPRAVLFWLAAVCHFFLLACTGGDSPGTGAGSVPGVSETEIRIGASLALGGHASYLGKQTIQGAMAYIRHVNDQGGVNGRKIGFIADDDGYDPPRCLANTQRLIVEGRVFALSCYVGTPTTVRVIPLIEEARIPLVGMFTGAHALREPCNRYLFNVRASYYQETQAAVKYLVIRRGIRHIAVFYQYDAYGFDGLRGVEIALKKHDLAPVGRGTYIRGSQDIGEGLEKIIRSGAQAVLMIGTYDACAAFILAARNRGFEPVFVNVSSVGADELARRLGTSGEGVIVTQVVPPPEAGEGSAGLPGVAEYISLISRYYPRSRPSFVGLEGYVNARVLVEGLRRAGRRLTREGFIAALESLKGYSVGIGAPIRFGPGDHQGLDPVYFTRIRGGRIVRLGSEG